MTACSHGGALPESHYLPFVTASVAQERLGRVSFPRRLWHQHGTGFRRLECVWLPYYHLTVTLDSSLGPGTLQAVVDAHAGCLAIVHTEGAAVKGPPAETHFPPKLPAEAAMATARRELTAKALSQRGSARRPHVRDIRADGILHWPYWVYYFERRAGRLDLRMLDALTGERPGHKLKLGLLDAFLASSQVEAGPVISEEEST